MAREERSSRSSICPLLIVRISLSITHKVPSLKHSLVNSGTPALKRRPNSPATKDWQARAAISGTAREFPSPVRHAARADRSDPYCRGGDHRRSRPVAGWLHDDWPARTGLIDRNGGG